MLFISLTSPLKILFYRPPLKSLLIHFNKHYLIALHTAKSIILSCKLIAGKKCFNFELNKSIVLAVYFVFFKTAAAHFELNYTWLYLTLIYFLTLY